MSGSDLANLVLAICAAFYLVTLFLYHFMVFRVNKYLSFPERIPHSLTFGQRDRLSKEYNALYPRSGVYRLTVSAAVAMFTLAILFAGIRIWNAAHGN